MTQSQLVSLFAPLRQIRIPSILCLILLGSLSLAAQDDCIQGKVLDPTGAPVPSIYVIAVSLNQASTEQVQTGSDGYFMMGYADEGAYYDVAASDKPSDNALSRASLVNAVRTRAASESHCPYLTLHYSARARLHLKVTNLFTGESIKWAGAAFRLSDERSWRHGVNKDGELLVPPSSDIDLQLAIVGYENSEILEVSTPSPGKVREVAIKLRPLQTGCVTGRVVDLQGAPVSQVRVQIGSGADRVTDANGSFHADGIQPGPHTIFVYAHALGYPISFRPEDGSSVDIDVASGSTCAEANIKLGPKAAKLLVNVVDVATQKPVEDVEAWLDASFSNGGGFWRVAVAAPMPVPAGLQFTLYVRADGYARPEPLTILPMQPEQTQQITIALRPDPSQSER